MLKRKSKKISAGLLIIWNNKILLAHPTNSPWRGTYTIPKGKVEKGEELIDTAIRETEEEIGILISKNDITDEPLKIDYSDEDGFVYKEVYYFPVFLEDEISNFKPQLKEVDWVGFLSKSEALDKIFWRFEPMLNFLV